MCPNGVNSVKWRGDAFLSVAIWESYGQYLGNEYDEPRNAGGARREWRDFGVLFGAQLRAKHGG